MNFDRGGQNLPAQRCRALFISQGLQEELNCLADIDKSLLDGLALRLASLQFWAPCVVAVLILFDYDTNLASHQPSFYRAHATATTRTQRSNQFRVTVTVFVLSPSTTTRSATCPTPRSRAGSVTLI